MEEEILKKQKRCMIPTSKIPLSKILNSDRYAIRLTTAAQAKKLIPYYPRMDDLELFFQTHSTHAEYAGPTHGPNGSELYFCNPYGKEIVEFSDVEF